MINNPTRTKYHALHTHDCIPVSMFSADRLYPAHKMFLLLALFLLVLLK